MILTENMNTMEMNNMEFHQVDDISKRSQINTAQLDNEKEVVRRVSADSSGAEDSNNMFTKFAFPFKLHSILENSEGNGQEAIISWLPSGKAFKIHKPKEFAAAIMPQYFNQTKYRSFQRQLYIYGFDRIKDKSSEDYGAYFHELFVRGKSDLCLDMQRKKIKGTGLSNEERRKKASNARASNKSESNAVMKMSRETQQALMPSDRLTTSNQSLFSTLGLNNNSLAEQLQRQKVDASQGWNSANAAAVLKSALQVQEFASRQENMELPINLTKNGNAGIVKVRGSRRCSLGFVRGGRRGSLLFDGDEVIFGDKKFHFTTEY